MHTSKHYTRITEFRTRRGKLQFSLAAVIALQTLLCVALAWCVQPSRVVATALFEIPDGNGCFDDVFPRISQADDLDFEARKELQTVIAKSTAVLAAAIRDPSVSSTNLISEQTDPVGWLQRRLQVSFPIDGELLEIALPGRETEAKELTLIVNAIATAYKSDSDSREFQRLFLNRDMLARSLEHLTKDIRSMQNASGSQYELEPLHRLAASMSMIIRSLDYYCSLRQVRLVQPAVLSGN
jgi:hypothetical protein